MNEVLRVSDALTLGDIARAAVSHERVSRLVCGMPLVTGNATSIRDRIGEFPTSQTDIRDCFLRVLLPDGSVNLWPIRELMEEYLEGQFVIKWPDSNE